jgi:hypothetical protein
MGSEEHYSAQNRIVLESKQEVYITESANSPPIEVVNIACSWEARLLHFSTAHCTV